jgi:DNA-binding beta-propeller fold protein YncE
MIDLTVMSKQEKILIAALFFSIVILLLLMFNPDNVKNDRKIAAEPQNILTQGGAPGTDRGFFQAPKDMAVDKDGDIYIVDSNNNRVQKYNNSGAFILSFGKKGNEPGDFNGPCGIDMGPDGNVYVADTWNGRIEEFSPTGSFIQMMGQNQGLWGPRDVAADRDGNVYALDTGNCLIYKYDKAGRLLLTFGKKGGGKADGQFEEPFSIKQGPDGNMYVVDRKNFRIQVITTSGKFVRSIPVNGWSAEQITKNGCLMEPYLDIDMKNGKIAVSDSTNRRVLVYSQSGSLIKTITADKNKAALMCPLGVVFYNGSILATDSATSKVLTLEY